MKIPTFADLKRHMVGVVALLFWSGCAPSPQDIQGPHGIILPHHLLVEHEMVAFLKEVFAERDPDTVERVILLSPNHFGYGYHNLQTTDAALQAANELWPLDLETLVSLVDETALEFEPEKLPLEHGITVPWTLLKDAFPNAALVPITLKSDTPQHELDALVDAFLALDLEHTLVVASIDFSHLTPEPLAVENDTATAAWLASPPPDPSSWHDALKALAHPYNLSATPDAVAFDSPEALYVLVRLMHAQDVTVFTLWKRTSSASLTGIEDPLQNTSHVFGIFP